MKEMNKARGWTRHKRREDMARWEKEHTVNGERVRNENPATRHVVGLALRIKSPSGRAFWVGGRWFGIRATRVSQVVEGSK